MKRKIIKINENKCIGCKLCVNACHEGAIGMVNGKAKLLKDDYCDGLGNCLPVCPVSAISFEERETLPYNKEAVKENLNQPPSLLCGCPGTLSKQINKTVEKDNFQPAIKQKSELSQWPIQIKLAPINAPYFQNADLLIAADCTAYAYGSFHNDFIKDRVTLIGCPKLDDTDYSKKLTEILTTNNIKTITVVRMEVPCCTGIEEAAKTAVKNSSKTIPLTIKVIAIDGKIK